MNFNFQYNATFHAHESFSELVWNAWVPYLVSFPLSRKPFTEKRNINKRGKLCNVTEIYSGLTCEFCPAKLIGLVHETSSCSVIETKAPPLVVCQTLAPWRPMWPTCSDNLFFVFILIHYSSGLYKLSTLFVV